MLLVLERVPHDVRLQCIQVSAILVAVASSDTLKLLMDCPVRAEFMHFRALEGDPAMQRRVLVISLGVFLFAEMGEACAAVAPEHSQPIGYGKGWECERGFREIAGRCSEVVVPANAH